MCSITTSTASYDTGYVFVGNTRALTGRSSATGEIMQRWQNVGNMVGIRKDWTACRFVILVKGLEHSKLEVRS